MLHVNSSSTHFPAAGIRIKQLIIVPIAQKYLYRNTCFLLNPYHNTLNNQLAQQPTFQLPMRLQHSMEFLVIKRSRKTLISLQSKRSKFPGKTQGGKSYLRTKKKIRCARDRQLKYGIPSNVVRIIPVNFLLKILISKEILPSFVYCQTGVLQIYTQKNTSNRSNSVLRPAQIHLEAFSKSLSIFTSVK